MAIAGGRHNHKQNEREFQRDCLARWVCNLPRLLDRQMFLLRFKRRHGEKVTEDLKGRIKKQWKTLTR